MDEEYPDDGTEQDGQGIYPERVMPRASPSGATWPPVAELPETGDDRVDAALAGLSRLPGTPAVEHVAVLEDVHGRLRDILGELNEGTP
jgi:hypothetical protein